MGFGHPTSRWLWSAFFRTPPGRFSGSYRADPLCNGGHGQPPWGALGQVFCSPPKPVHLQQTDSRGKEKQELLRLSAFASLALPVCNREINVYCQRTDNAL